VFSSLTDRGVDHRALSRKLRLPGKIILNYAGIGIVMLTLIENTVTVTIRHSDNEPIASEATTASVSRDEATGAERPSKPAAPGDRIMAEFLRCAGESPATTESFTGIAGNIAAVTASKTPKCQLSC
jgi:hypothetical protein